MSKIHDAIARARLYRPYLGSGLVALTPVEVEGMPTMGVDRYWRLYYGPEVFDKWSPKECSGAVIHEVSHLLRGHSKRFDAVAGIPEIWNMAADCEINDDHDLFEPECPLPDIDLCIPSKFGAPDGLLAEEYYHHIMSKVDIIEIRVVTCGGGSGVGGSAPWECGPPSPDNATPGMSGIESDVVVKRVAEDIKRHITMKGVGSVPAGLRRWAEDAVRAPTIPWQDVLAAHVRAAVSYVAGRVDYTYARLSRRQGARDDIRLPGSVKPNPKIAVVIDTSASMDDPDIAAALNEVEGICRATGGTITPISCDADAVVGKQIHRAADVVPQLVGGGGTDMGHGIAAAEELDCDICVVMTDGYTPWPEGARMPVIAAIIGCGPDAPSWINTVRVELDDDEDYL